jgi:hypothetical protein
MNSNTRVAGWQSADKERSPKYLQNDVNTEKLDWGLKTYILYQLLFSSEKTKK